MLATLHSRLSVDGAWSSMLRTCVLVALLPAHAPALLAQEAAPPAVPLASDVILRPGDVLQISIWPDQELGGEFPIEESGVVYLPVLGRLEAAGMPLDEFRSLLRDQYATVLKQPVVNVIPLFPVYVLGGVLRPGLYRVGPTATTFDVVSQAGGFSRNAKANRARIIRDGTLLEVDMRALFERADDLSLLRVRSGDRILIPEGRRIFTFQNVFSALQIAIWGVTLYELIRR